MAAEQVETSKVYARNVARIEPEWIEQCAAHLVKHNYYDPHWAKKSARCMVSERTLLYGLTLQAGRKIPTTMWIPRLPERFLFARRLLIMITTATRSFMSQPETARRSGHDSA